MSNYKHHFLFDKKNFTFVLIGVAFILVGFFLMLGGGEAPDLTKTYPEDTLYGFRTTILAPIIVLIGFGIQIVAIFMKPSEEAMAKVREQQTTTKAKRKFGVSSKLKK